MANFFSLVANVAQSRGATVKGKLTNKRFAEPLTLSISGAVPDSGNTADVIKAAQEALKRGGSVSIGTQMMSEHGDKYTSSTKLEEVGGEGKDALRQLMMAGAIGSAEEHEEIMAVLEGLKAKADAEKAKSAVALVEASKGATVGNANGAAAPVDPRGVGAALNGGSKSKKGANGAAD